MIDQIRRVAELREQVAAQQKRRNDLLVAWKEEHKVLLESLDERILELTEAEASLKADAIADFLISGNTAPAPGLIIKQYTELRYDKEAALNWAIKHELRLALDKKAFEGLVKDNPPDFVEVVRVPKATIAQDLSKVLIEITELPF